MYITYSSEGYTLFSDSNTVELIHARPQKETIVEPLHVGIPNRRARFAGPGYPRYTEIISKPPVLFKAGHSIFPG